MQVEVESWKVQFFMKLTSDITVWLASFFGDASSRCKRTNLSKEPKLDPLQQSLKCAWGLMQTPSNAVPRCTQWHEIRIDADVARPTRQTPPFAEFVGRRGYQLQQLHQPVADLPAPVWARARSEQGLNQHQQLPSRLCSFLLCFLGCNGMHQR